MQLTEKIAQLYCRYRYQERPKARVQVLIRSKLFGVIPLSKSRWLWIDQDAQNRCWILVVATGPESTAVGSLSVAIDKETGAYLCGFKVVKPPKLARELNDDGESWRAHLQAVQAVEAAYAALPSAG